MTGLQVYAAHETHSAGREYAEANPEYRGEYQRDRDRIIHCAAFRRLEYKTQVFVNHEGDMFRTRLTHSIEVAQIARTIARALHLNEDLTEAIALAHDLGHTPFGHAGQDALNACLLEYGGFEHNLQSLRVVEYLERRYPAFPGLNLTFETREGILKHCPPEQAESLGALGRRFILGHQAGLEAQVANIADEIAYNNHDIDDGLRAGLLQVSQLLESDFFAREYHEVERIWGSLDQRRMASEVIRRMINRQVIDLIETSQAAIAAAQPEDIAAVRACPRPLIGFSPPMGEQHRGLKRFLHAALYRHEHVQAMTDRAQMVVSGLYQTYSNDIHCIPGDTRRQIEQQLQPELGEAAGLARGVADYIAGMTDRFALAEHQRLCGQ